MEALAMRLCLDTHAVIWCLADDHRLGKNVHALVSSSSRNDLVISDVVLLETSLLVTRGRLRVEGGEEAFLESIAASFRVLPIDPRIARLAATLDLPHGDPFDRVITATALVHGIPLATRDRQIVASGKVEVVW